MKTLLSKRNGFLLMLILFQSCGTMLTVPSENQSSTLGEMTPYTKQLKELPVPKEKIVIGVYKFKDQTGQYKMQENGSSWSTAIPQGTTSILLKALEDSKWFRPIERENIANLLNERQIIRSTRKEYQVAADGVTEVNDQLPPLLYAGILLEGGIISYDSNVMTGGFGARYFGLGAGTQYRQDRVTVYLRLVSSMTGEILKTVYTSKNILSTSINGSFFRYIDMDRLLEVDMGMTKNEPVQVAVKEAIEKSVYTMILEGMKDNLWDMDTASKAQRDLLMDNYKKEEMASETQRFDNRILENRRGKFGVGLSAESVTPKTDYSNGKMTLGEKINAKMFISDNFNVELNFAQFRLENTGNFNRKFNTADVNLEYIVLPKDNLTPYVYGGVGLIGFNYAFVNNLKGKFQTGGGIEYLIKNNIGLRVYGEYNYGFTDDWDLLVAGKRKDAMMKFGAGLTYYFGKSSANFSNPKKTKKP